MNKPPTERQATFSAIGQLDEITALYNLLRVINSVSGMGQSCDVRLHISGDERDKISIYVIDDDGPTEIAPIPDSKLFGNGGVVDIFIGE